MFWKILFCLLVLAVSAAAQAGKVRIRAEVWADNWFAFYLGEKFVKEDSVPITTERSFNAETFTFDAEYPLVLNFVVKDFKENDTGLEYIGTRRQQMGDGGLIAQFTDADTGALVAVTNAGWRCLVTHDAPLDPACERERNPVAGRKPCEFTALEEPKNWKSPGFDDSQWSPATVYTAAEVGPKGGYDEIVWNPAAKFIWGPNLKTNNTVLCRLTVGRNKN
ncbi:MAG: PEBP family protein [Acidobacteria bacterium]|nr:PEBP family protein [Acidobacteriota bacterium]